MAKQIFFSNCILSSFVTSNSINDLIIEELQAHEKNNIKRTNSNRGGFQTKDITNEKICNFFLNESANLLRYNLEFKNPLNINLNNLWINKNKKVNYNVPHVHPLSNFSGVYYVEVPKTGGELYFLNNDISNVFTDNHNFLEDECFKTEYIVKPKKNKLYLFPSNLLHGVHPHYEETDRISISFNLEFKYG